MRVLTISHMYPNKANPVAGLFVHDQVREFIALGHDARVLSPIPAAPPLLSRLHSRWQALCSQPRAAVLDGVPARYPRYLSLPRMLLFSLSGELCFRGIASTARDLRAERDFDLIHAHTVMPDGFAAMRLNQHWRKPLIITVHGYDAVQLNQGRFRRRQMLRAMAAADRIICVSDRLRKACLEHYPHPEKFAVVHNGFRPPQSSEATPVVPPAPPGKPSLLSVGHLIPLKGHRYVLEAVAQLKQELPDIRYRVIGDGAARADLERQVRDLGIGEQVSFLGRLPHHELAPHYASCDIFVLPSSPEGFGIVYLEAMSFGKSVIGCQGEGISEIIEDGRTGVLVPPQDAAALVDAIRGLAHDLTRVARIGSEARETALRYTWRVNAERVLRLYTEVRGHEEGD